MNDPTLIADLIRAGVDPDLVNRVAVALIEAPVRRPSADESADFQAERRRAADRERAKIRRQSADSPQTPQIVQNAPLFLEDKNLKKEKRERATRMSADWQLSERGRKFAVSSGMPAIRIPISAQKFKNHWLAKSGATATKHDWEATWENWVIGDLERSGIAAPTPAVNGVPARAKPPWELYGISEAQWRTLPPDYAWNKEKYGEAHEWLKKQEIRGSAAVGKGGHDQSPQLQLPSGGVVRGT